MILSKRFWRGGVLLTTCLLLVDLAHAEISPTGTPQKGTSSSKVPSLVGAEKPSLDNLWGNAPEWLSRVYLEGSLSTDSAPEYSLETVQPLWQPESLNQVVFTQLRAAYTNGKWTLNGGVGYRYLTPEHDWMFGGNAFFDEQVNDQHQRLGLGAEVMQRYLTWRGNLYNGISGWRTIERASSYTISERALSGLDTSLEAPMPYLPYSRFQASYYHWDRTTAKDIDGIDGRFKINVSSNVNLEAGASHDSAGNAAYVNLRFIPGGSRTGDSTLMQSNRTSEGAFEARDLSKHMLDRVERRNNIATERRTTAAGSVTGVRVIVRRGS